VRTHLLNATAFLHDGDVAVFGEIAFYGQEKNLGGSCYRRTGVDDVAPSLTGGRGFSDRARPPPPPPPRGGGVVGWVPGNDPCARTGTG